MARMAETNSPLVGVIMGSKSDWETMRAAADVLAEFGVPHESQIVSAHRTPQRMADYAAEAEGRGLEVIIAGAGGAAHLPGMVASQTVLPVLGVPVQSDRPDAGRHPGRHACHRHGWREERRVARRANPRQHAAGAAEEVARVSPAANERRARPTVGLTLCHDGFSWDQS
jgi:hypothetical protein